MNQPLFKRDEDMQILYKIEGMLQETMPVIKEFMKDNNRTLHGSNGDIGLVGQVSNLKSRIDHHENKHEKSKAIRWKILYALFGSGFVFTIYQIIWGLK